MCKNIMISALLLLSVSACFSNGGTMEVASNNNDWFCKYYEDCEAQNETAWFWQRGEQTN